MFLSQRPNWYLSGIRKADILFRTMIFYFVPWYTISYRLSNFITISIYTVKYGYGGSYTVKCGYSGSYTVKFGYGGSYTVKCSNLYFLILTEKCFQGFDRRLVRLGSHIKKTSLNKIDCSQEPMSVLSVLSVLSAFLNIY